MPRTFPGIDEKLARANENIRNLKIEIDSFFESSDYPTIPDVDDERVFQALEYHRDRPIPIRLAVIAGEVVHHLRSCLDHIVWDFSSETYRNDFFYKIQFPILEKEPVDKKELARYDGMIEGITNPAVRTLTSDCQPYKTADPVDCPLLILHKMDVVDKHRELILCATNAEIGVPLNVLERIMRDKPKGYEITPADLVGQLKPKVQTIPRISFRDFGRKKIHPVVPGLNELSNYVAGVVAMFAAV